ncbi:MAG: hypothetical protein U1E19_05525 [Rhodoblastus sp.]
MADDPAPSPDQIARLKRRYEKTDERLADIAADEGVTMRLIGALRREHGWRLRSARGKATSRGRRKPAATKKAAATRAKPRTPTPARARQVDAGLSQPPPGVVDMPTLIARIRAQLEGALATAQARGPEADPDDTARLMASLTRTLQSLRALEKDTPDDGRRGDGPDALPLDLAELRRELARRIDLLREDREGS